jgi:hypothetical protein
MTELRIRPSRNCPGNVWLELWVDGKRQEQTLYSSAKLARSVARQRHPGVPVIHEPVPVVHRSPKPQETR